jgi:RNA-directed DNA polymerase
VICLRASITIPTSQILYLYGERMDEAKEKICKFRSLYKAMHRCKKNVMWKDSVAGYIKNGLVNTYKLRRQLLDGSYKIDKYSVFTIYEPKIREIVSTRMKDRVFQRSMSDNYLYAEITKSFIYDNHACQVGKGTSRARARLVRHMQQYFKKHGMDGWVLQCDLTNFFGSTHHDIAKNAVSLRVSNEWVNNHTYKIIDSFNQGEDPEVGMGLGSQITQLIELAVLDRLDHIIKEELRIKYYIRYNDDFILMHEDKEHLKYCLKRINEHITSLGLILSKKKTRLYPLKQRIKFLGFKFQLTKTGKVIKRLSKENVTHVKRKLRRMKKLVDIGVLTKEDVDKCLEAWKAHAKQGNTHSLILSMNRFYENLWKEGNEHV